MRSILPLVPSSWNVRRAVLKAGDDDNAYQRIDIVIEDGSP